MLQEALHMATININLLEQLNASMQIIYMITNAIMLHHSLIVVNTLVVIDTIKEISLVDKIMLQQTPIITVMRSKKNKMMLRRMSLLNHH